MNAILRHRFPWTPEDEALLVQRKRSGARHKQIARELNRTPRSVDEQVARFKARGLLAMHRREETELLAKIEAEARHPDPYPYEGPE